MANTIRFWGPDTCKCRVFFEYDVDVAAEDRVHAYATRDEAVSLAERIATAENRATKEQPEPVLCPGHSAVGHVPALYAVLVEESVRKNISLGIASSSLGIRDLTTQWEFDDARVLHMRVIGAALTTQQIEGWQAAVDLQFGPTKVLVS